MQYMFVSYVCLIFLAIFCHISVLADTVLEELSLEEKVGQLMMVFFKGEEVNDEARILFQQAHVGSVIYYTWANGLHYPKQIQKLSYDLQVLAKEHCHGIPLFIAIDQEGGVVNRLNNGFTVFPGNGALGKTKLPILAEKCARATGKELLTVGINMNLAPVADVHTNPATPIIGIRTFSSSPKEVVSFCEHMLKGYLKAGIIATVKHFPGYGHASLDPHLGLSVVHKTQTELERNELHPFKELLAHTDSLMMAHIMMPALDPHNCATLSEAIIEGLLRKKWGYEGVVVTDSLVMEGLLESCGNIQQAAIQAILAGNDILCFGGKLVGQGDMRDSSAEDLVEVHEALVRAVQEGIIPMERLDRSLKRVLKLKNAYRLYDKDEQSYQLMDEVLVEEHKQLAREIANLSIVQEWDRRLSSMPPLNQMKVAVIAPQVISDVLLDASIKQLGLETKCLFWKLEPTQEEELMALELETWADIVVVCSFDAWKYEQQRRIISALSLSKPMIVLGVSNPEDALLFPNAAAMLLTHSPSPYSIQAAIQRLFSKM